ncbi:hypothetical protein CkaCkLH20_00548 [Colletotrichum karsti]|uniref:Uncharacterized protein n=1 Tax=Colletotrichum karsti TaxID=1095194 RepID=A0A9P6LRE0_9PEZI|nr:uncharacterized protein CkaCkLH20_00548 [Colletotrichum karsti]KAF9882512.1 hypothetical protein CkaCkLH20_00548 [Colletotrichum karsti]
MISSQQLLGVLLFATMAAGQACYLPNGERHNSARACPAVEGEDAQACCYDGHYCLSNGLCFVPSSLTMYRASCTDQKFTASGCPRYCLESGSSHCGVWACGDNKGFACSMGFCDSGNFSVSQGIILSNAAVLADLNITSSASATSSAATATGASSSSTSSTSSSSAESSSCVTGEASGGISAGAAAGIGAGIGVPLAIAVGALTFMLLREKRKKMGPSAVTPTEGYAKTDGPPTNAGWVYGSPPNHDVRYQSQGGVRHELPYEARHELPQ